MDRNVAAISLASVDTTSKQVTWNVNGMDFAGVHWPGPAGATDEPPIVLIHGWLDNCLSFVHLAPELARSADVYAFDMAGHGLTDHRPAAQPYALLDYVADLADLLDRHFTTPVNLVGHSLGGIVSALYAAAFPESVSKLVLIDSLGPTTRPPEQFVQQMRKSIAKRLSGSGVAAVYPTIEAAAKLRTGGAGGLSHEAAMILVPRNLKAVEGGFSWGTDPKLRHPSVMMMTEDQVQESLRAVTTETLFVRAEGGYLAGRKGFEERLDAIPHLKEVVVSGSHHCHLDGDAGPVSKAIREFLFSAK